MMKRKFLAVVLPIVGCATLVGSGFSAWYFGATGQFSDVWNSTIDVTGEVINENSVISLRTLTTTEETNYLGNSSYFVMDQGTVDTNATNYSDIGIAFSNSANLSVVGDNPMLWGLVASYTDQNRDLATLYNIDLEIEITLTISVHDTLEQYVKLDTANVKANVTESVGSTTTQEGFDDSPKDSGDFTVYTIQFRPTIQGVEQSDVDWTITLDLGTIEKKNNLFTYEDKPKTRDKYSDMLGVLDGVGTMLRFDASIAIKDKTDSQ